MNQKALYCISYGLFVLTARQGQKDNGCMINTAMQLTSTPNRLGVTVNKANATHDMVLETRKFTVSVLSKKANFDLIRRFGFQSGREINKFQDYEYAKRNQEGMLYVTEGTNAFLSVEVEETIDLGTHTMFIGNVTEMEVLDSESSATYEYYQTYIKPRPGAAKAKRGQTVWRCKVCGYEYTGEELPYDFICPVCKHPASDFERVEE